MKKITALVLAALVLSACVVVEKQPDPTIIPLTTPVPVGSLPPAIQYTVPPVCVEALGYLIEDGANMADLLVDYFAGVEPSTAKKDAYLNGPDYEVMFPVVEECLSLINSTGAGAQS